MLRYEKIVDGCLLSVGTFTGLANIQQILGIIILVIQIAWIVVKLAVKIIDNIKSGESLDKIDGDVGSVIDQIGEFKDALKSLEDEEENGQDNEQE